MCPSCKSRNTDSISPRLSAHSGDHVVDGFHLLERGADHLFRDCINVHRLAQFRLAGLAILRSDQNFRGVPQVLLRQFSRAPVLSDAVHYFARIKLAFAQFFCPPTPRVERIPQGPFLISPAGSRVVVAESVDNRIPCWTVCRDQDLLCQTDPHRIKNQPPTPEILKAQIVNNSNRLRVFA